MVKPWVVLETRWEAQQRGVGVGVYVDEAGGHDAAVGVDHRVGLGGGELADGGDPVALDGDVGAIARGALPIDDDAVANDDIEHSVESFGGLLSL